MGWAFPQLDGQAVGVLDEGEAVGADGLGRDTQRRQLGHGGVHIRHQKGQMPQPAGLGIRDPRGSLRLAEQLQDDVPAAQKGHDVRRPWHLPDDLKAQRPIERQGRGIIRGDDGNVIQRIQPHELTSVTRSTRTGPNSPAGEGCPV